VPIAVPVDTGPTQVLTIKFFNIPVGTGVNILKKIHTSWVLMLKLLLKNSYEPGSGIGFFNKKISYQLVLVLGFKADFWLMSGKYTVYT